MKRQIRSTLAMVAALGLSACGPSDGSKQTTPEPGGVLLAQHTLSGPAAEAAGADEAQGGEVAQATIDKAKDLIQQVRDDIAGRDFDGARSAMEQLRRLRDSLPQALHDEIDRLDAMLTGITVHESHLGS